MLSVLANRTYRRLFAAQVVALLGTGLLTVALGLLAYEIGGERAGAVLGTALAIKMVAYVGVAPIVGAYANLLPRRAFLVSMDAVRGLIAVALPFVTQELQVYVLIFLLQSASAAFTPTFQATIPDVLPEERDYTRALSLSRLAYDLESLVSPMLAAALLTVVSFHTLFVGTVVGFVLSASMVLATTLPQAPPVEHMGGVYEKTTRGIRIYLATPRLRGLLALNLAAAAAGSMVIVNTVLIIQGYLGRGQPDVALALASFGAGSMATALALPRLLDRFPDRPVMLSAAGVLGLLLLASAAGFKLLATDKDALWPLLLVVWSLLGVGYSGVLTPSGRLLRRSSHPVDRPALFAAQFALSHAAWLLTYPLAGWLGARGGMTMTLCVLGLLPVLGFLLAATLWPTHDPDVIEHDHPELGPDHPHVVGMNGSPRHAHPFVIDEHHRRWPEKVGSA